MRESNSSRDFPAVWWKRKHGRIILVIILFLYFSSIFISSFFTDYSVFWAKYLRVTTSKPEFLDTHHLTSALECTEKGYDVLAVNPCEPNLLPMDYPRIWLHLSKLGIDQSHSRFIGIGFGFFFFVSLLLIIGQINMAEGALLSVMICSPSIMMGVEAGNTDLLMFVLIAMSVLLLQRAKAFRWIAYPLILTAGILKLYPIAAMSTCLKERGTRALLTLIILLALFGFYVHQIFPDIQRIQMNAVKSTYLSYGASVLYDILLAAHFGGTQFLTFVTGLMVLVLGIAYWMTRSKKDEKLDTAAIDSFRAGAAIYLLSYFFWNNWDYRLIFLLFTIPQMLRWIRQRNGISLLTRAAILLMAITFWISSRVPPAMDFKLVTPFWFDELLNLFLAIYFTFALLLTIPEWLKPKAHLSG